MAEPRAFVCGHPVKHSRSPLIHNHWLKTLALPGSYGRMDVAPADIRAFIAGLAENGYAGGNFTLPHKEAAYEAVVRRDQAAELIGAVNTIWLDDGVLCGSNSDAMGFSGNLDDRAPEWRQGRTAVVLGAGGAARAVVHAVLEAGYADLRIVNRTKARATELAHRFGVRCSAHGGDALPELLADADLVVNTTSLGMDGNAELPADVAGMPDRALVTDIVYVPLMTPLLAAAAERGLKTVDGLGMLLHQAVPGFERWFGVRPRVTEELRNLIVADMESH